MAEKREYKEMYEKFINYEQDLHLENQKRIRIGLKVNIILPLFFLIMSFAISEGKLVFLVLWILSLFGIAFYLIYVEYSDYKMMEQMKEFGVDVDKLHDDTSLIAFSMNLFDIVGINQDDRGENLIVLTPSDHMLVPDFPGLPEDGCTITFERDVALSREDAQFITWEHPLIRNGLDLILSGDTGSSTISLLKNKALPVGTLLLELIYVVEAQAPKQLQLNRFLPATPVRMLLDKNGNNLAAQVEFESFNRQLSAVNRHTGSKLVNAVQQDVHAILQQGEAQIAKAAQGLIDAARNEADEKLTAELSRLEALKAVNPNIRDDELAAIESNRQQVMDALAQAGWRLDALRLIVVTHQ